MYENREKFSAAIERNNSRKKKSRSGNIYIRIFRINIFWMNPQHRHAFALSLCLSSLSFSLSLANSFLEARDASSGTQWNVLVFHRARRYIHTALSLARTQSLFIYFSSRLLCLFNWFFTKISLNSSTNFFTEFP